MMVVTKMLHELQGLVAGHLPLPVAPVLSRFARRSTARRPAVDPSSAAASLLIRNMTAVRRARHPSFTKDWVWIVGRLSPSGQATRKPHARGNHAGAGDDPSISGRANYYCHIQPLRMPISLILYF
jgi:hypothetical protein